MNSIPLTIGLSPIVVLMSPNWIGREVVIEGTLVLTFVGVLITTVGLLWTKVIRPILTYVETIHTVITRELSDDGNGSTKSKVNKIEQAQTEANEKLIKVQDEAHAERKKIQQTLDEHVQNLEIHRQAHREEREEQAS